MRTRLSLIEEQAERGIGIILEISRLPAARKLRILRRIASELAHSQEAANDLANARTTLEASTAASADPIDAAGGTLSAREIGKILGCLRRGTVNARRKRGDLIGIPKGRAYRYPAFQLKDGKPLDGLRESLSILCKAGLHNPEAQAIFLLSHHHSRSGASHRPIDLLRAGLTKHALDLIEINAAK